MSEQFNLEKQQGFLERVYKSRISRTLALASALAFFGQFGARESRDSHKESREVSKDTLDLGNLDTTFRAEKAEDGKQYILHIGQMHADFQLETSRRTYEKEFEGGMGRLIENQKHIEDLIQELSKKYGIQNFYLEDTPSTFDLESLTEKRGEIQKKLEADPYVAGDHIQALYNEASKGTLDSDKGPMMYLLSCQLGSVINRVERQIQQGGVSDLLLVKLAQYKALRDQLAANDLIKGDNIYIWGGALKLFLEEKINIKLAESKTALEEITKKTFKKRGEIALDAEMASTDERLKSASLKAELLSREKEFLGMSIEHSNQREDATISVISKDFGNGEKYYPVIYGLAHIFDDNVTQYKKGTGADIGLINIMEK